MAHDIEAQGQVLPAKVRQALEWLTPEARKKVDNQAATERVADRAENKLFRRLQKAANDAGGGWPPSPPDEDEAASDDKPRPGDDEDGHRRRHRDGGAAAAIETVWFYVMVFVRLTRSYARGEYRDIDRESMIIVVAALLYFLSPVDLIPDFIPGGLVDDAAVFAFAASRLQEVLDDYIRWVDQQP